MTGEDSGFEPVNSQLDSCGKGHREAGFFKLVINHQMYQLLAQFAATIKNTVYHSLKLDQRQNGLMSFYSKTSIPQWCCSLKYWLIDLNDLTLNKCATILIIFNCDYHWSILSVTSFCLYDTHERHLVSELRNTWCQNKVGKPKYVFTFISTGSTILSTFNNVATPLMCTVIFVLRDFVIWLFC